MFDAILNNNFCEGSSTYCYLNIKKWSINKDRNKYLNKIASYKIYTEEIKKVSSVLSEKALKTATDNLIPSSFIMQCKFRLKSPYHSRDDDEFYIIDNPVMKDKIWKIPMVRGSSWKGAFMKAALAKLNDYVEQGKINDVIKYYLSILRIFGAGSEDFRKVEDIIKEFNQKTDQGKLINALISYSLEEIGVNLKLKIDGKNVIDKLWENIKKKGNSSYFEDMFKVKRGRAIFYPTYFNKLSLEVINPHKRKTKAGTQPIYYEVVPKNTEGIFQAVYIPYDAIQAPLEEIKKQAADDQEVLKSLLVDVLEERGIGAKSKLGWGKAKVKQEHIKIYSHLEEERYES